MTQPSEISTGPAPPTAGGEDLLARLRSDGFRHQEAVGELHTLLLRAARFELARRAAELARVRGEEREDLALQAADDAFVAIMDKLDDFRGDSRFTTWAYKFALYEAATRVRRRAWQHREVVLDPEAWLTIRQDGTDPAAHARRNELLTTIRQLIDTELTDRQRTVLVALTIQEIPIDVLAERLDTTRGALYKSLHDARRKLRLRLTAAGHDLDLTAP